MKDLLRIADLSPDDLTRVLDDAAATRAHPRAWRNVLAGETVVTYFAKPSTCTRLSLGSAITRLGGVDITVAAPPGYEPHHDVVDAAEALAARSGALVRTTHDPYLAVADADAVYTDVWLSMGTPDEERAARAAALEPYRVDEALLAMASPDAIFLHCLPAHRCDEVSATVIDGRRSVVFDQAENRMHTAVAVLRTLVVGTLAGATPLAMAS